MSPLSGAHQLGWDGDLVVRPANANNTAIMKIEADGGYEMLDRADVERLRDLCTEALE